MFSYTKIMVGWAGLGWAGAPQSTPVANKCGKANSVLSTTQTHPLLAVPFSAATDFTVLVSHCENFAETLIKSKDIA
jgi:hypothetical protein